MSDIKSTWQHQPTEEPIMLSLDDIRLRADKLRSRFHRRNWLLYAYSIFNIIACIAGIVSGKFPRQQAPTLLMIAAHLFVLWQVWHRIGPRESPPQSSGQTALQFYRRELEHQHGAVEKAWLWYIAPFMPPFLWQLGIWLSNIAYGTPAGATSIRMFTMVVFSAVLFWGCVWLLFSHHATRLELELERLNGVRAE